ncbi:MAG: cytochrome C [Planctomycetes bacterium]|nr:cytochrome C [Planctomycetota bacterium]
MSTNSHTAGRGRWLFQRLATWEVLAALGVAGLALWMIFSADALGAPPPAPPPPLNSAGRGPQSPVAVLGRTLFFDTTLSNPAGMSCASCHAPQVGFTYPDSDENLDAGPVEGVVPGRFGNRKPPTVSYASFIPHGPTPMPVGQNGQTIFVGGLFWDGRAPDLPTQAGMPFVNPNEMNDIVHNLAAPELVVQQVLKNHLPQFVQAYGAGAAHGSTSDIFKLICAAIATWESTPEVSPFNSKFDAVMAGRAQFTPSELSGFRLFTGSATGRAGGAPMPKHAQCSACHSLQPGPGRDLFTNNGYFNTGVPKNPDNPFYNETDAVNNPLGYNPLGAAYIDLGLGDFIYSKSGLGTAGGDTLRVNGTFKTPTLRNIDKRPSPSFIKAYSHNGFFKHLMDVVHFYNTRNLTSRPGEVIDFTQANPYAKLRGKPLWPTPEYPSAQTLVNPAGLRGGIGNLGLTPQDETDIVNFMSTLSDQ